jgi:hypothetical protein
VALPFFLEVDARPLQCGRRELAQKICIDVDDKLLERQPKSKFFDVVLEEGH